MFHCNVDIDECSTTDNCDQICKNTLNSFECSCVVGYELVNKTACKAINSKYKINKSHFSSCFFFFT